MAQGSELIFQLDDTALRSLLSAADLAELDSPAGPPDVEAEEWPDGRRYWLLGVADDAARDGLREVHRQLGADRFDPKARWVDGVTDRPDPNGEYLRARTPAGIRRFSRLSIEAFGLEHDELAVAGISIWGRYFPVWADWRFPHGGSGAPIRFDGELTEMAEQARAALADVIPAVASAPLVVVDRFY